MKIDIANRSGSRVHSSRFRHDAALAFRILGGKRTPRSLVIAFVRRGESARLKLRYLGTRDRANILSFRYDDAYAEVVLTPSIIAREARRDRIPVSRAMRGMLIHGLLHIAGFHHEAGGILEKRFEAIEQRIFSKLGININRS